MFIEYDLLMKESERLLCIVKRMNLLQDELKGICIRLSEDMETLQCIPEYKRILAAMDVECVEIRKAARFLTYLSELCRRCDRRVGETLEYDPVYYDERYNWVENHIRQEARIVLENKEES